ncbi:hypothetical protein [Cacatuid alphaherpesvirus 2]|uniref:Uncharacterized protein n=1 Tax=Cacatuid alphaherpesvirus 2 TaxID=2604840 RepID=A0A5B9RBW0_9ALPH|nr:hypothetical protein QKT46_gp67 [Cacatuid alphaherpesvirus 2]QEG54107.1 hypothetical protein [Cacatuid alphaherpesvirus 2]
MGLGQPHENKREESEADAKPEASLAPDAPRDYDVPDTFIPSSADESGSKPEPSSDRDHVSDRSEQVLKADKTANESSSDAGEPRIELTCDCPVTHDQKLYENQLAPERPSEIVTQPAEADPRPGTKRQESIG